jgi:signal transduction histidine kinase
MEFADRINKTGKVHMSTDFFGLEKRLDELMEVSLYRIIQEWTNNILKYANADRIMVQITRDKKELTLVIEDNGAGFDSEKLKKGGGNGWKNINSRINLIKGVLELDTHPGHQGSTLILNVPVGKKNLRETADGNQFISNY